MTEFDITNRSALTRQRRLLNPKTQIAQLEEELLVIEEHAGPSTRMRHMSSRKEDKSFS